MVEKIRKFIEKHHMIAHGDRVLVALSGGADSVSLLLALKELEKQYDLQLSAVHVEHGIRGEESLRDAQFCEQLCETYGVTFQMFFIDAPAYSKKHGMSLEEAARELRYQCLEQAAQKLDVKTEADAGGTNEADVRSANEAGTCHIAVAHHMQDQCETMLFHLCRGTGLEGMRGILPVRDRIIRPLLCVSRTEIEAYLSQKGQGYCTDSTNLELQYARNRIRHQILPQLQELNAGAPEHFLQFSEEAAETVEYLDEQVQAAYAKMVREEHLQGPQSQEEQLQGAQIFCVDGAQLQQEHLVIQRRLIYRVICQLAGRKKDITKAHVEAVRRLLAGETGKKSNLPYGIIAQMSYGNLYLKKENKSEQSLQEAVLAPGGETQYVDGWKIDTRIFDFTGDMSEISQKTYTKWFDYDRIMSVVSIRHRLAGDYLQVTATGGKKKLKDYFIDIKMPRQEREKVLLFTEGSHVIWAVTHRISEAYKITENTARVLEIRVEKQMGEM